MVSRLKQKGILGTNPMLAVAIVAIQRQIIPRLSCTAESAISILVRPLRVAVDDYLASVFLGYQWLVIVHTSDTVPLESNL